MYDVCTMERTNIYLDERELASLRAVSRSTGRPVAALVREAVDTWLDQHGVVEIAEDEWSRRFKALLDRRGRLAAAERWSPDSVDADVRAAVAEVRSSRAARRR
jgi:predicted DNA-binding protein